jgi:hypothetical protein
MLQYIWKYINILICCTYHTVHCNFLSQTNSLCALLKEIIIPKYACNIREKFWLANFCLVWFKSRNSKMRSRCAVQYTLTKSFSFKKLLNYASTLILSSEPSFLCHYWLLADFQGQLNGFERYTKKEFSLLWIFLINCCSSWIILSYLFTDRKTQI